ncbi:TetR/AcrR family transcriptional regulator [Nocardioides sp. SOB77]|uniref:TetR/AcrR family transcriptional regulator n=1 Tax=Nocardioides oceani TaxID=3058369 RepID=A0ABT8FME4_9ACTN|nr:TetR/AcrR family transcriptional regulator [Nocardioides oceani]MDN4175685.1 TetR/AcrR family transcriptional regulator [Nocardioides oceani]
MTAPELADWRTYDAPTLPRVLDAALRCFAEQGYHGTSIRDLASEAGLSVPGVYHHHKSKQEILVALVMAVMDELLGRSEAALASAPEDPSAQFDALVESLLRFHMFRRQQAFVASTEIRSLAPESRRQYVDRRDEQQRMLDRVVVAGADAGVFGTPYPLDAARAVATLCVGVASWYREDGPLDPDELVARHLVLARGLVQG